MQGEITGCIIDGAVPRTDSERVGVLLDEANDLLDRHYKASIWQEFNSNAYKRYWELMDEYRLRYKEEEFLYWHEIEDDVIDLINDLLPDDVVCLLHPDDPGTVVIWDVRDAEE